MKVMQRLSKFLIKNRQKLAKEAFAFITCISFYNIIEKNFIGAALTKGRSMEPTLEDSNVVIIDRFFFKKFKRFHLKRNDIVVAKSIENTYSKEADNICKRIKGM
jgi:signal peptidase I